MIMMLAAQCFFFSIIYHQSLLHLVICLLLIHHVQSIFLLFLFTLFALIRPSQKQYATTLETECKKKMHTEMVSLMSALCRIMSSITALKRSNKRISLHGKIIKKLSHDESLKTFSIFPLTTVFFSLFFPPLFLLYYWFCTVIFCTTLSILSVIVHRLCLVSCVSSVHCNLDSPSIVTTHTNGCK